MDEERLDSLGRTLSNLEGLGGALVPHLLVAAAILVGGWLLALVLAWVTRRIVHGVVAWLPAGRLRETARDAIDEDRSARLAGKIVFWIGVAIAFMAATEALQLPVLTAWLGGVLRYVPRLLVAALVVLVGLFGGRLAATGASRMAAAAGSSSPERLGAIANACVVTVSGLVAVDQLGVEIAFLTSALLIALAAVLGGSALAFGLGARTAIANILGAHYARQECQVGQRVRVDGVEGRVVRVSAIAIVLETKEGQVHVPADAFAKSTSVLLSAGDAR